MCFSSLFISNEHAYWNLVLSHPCHIMLSKCMQCQIVTLPFSTNNVLSILHYQINPPLHIGCNIRWSVLFYMYMCENVNELFHLGIDDNMMCFEPDKGMKCVVCGIDELDSEKLANHYTVLHTQDVLQVFDSIHLPEPDQPTKLPLSTDKQTLKTTLWCYDSTHALPFTLNHKSDKNTGATRIVSDGDWKKKIVKVSTDITTSPTKQTGIYKSSQSFHTNLKMVLICYWFLHMWF